MQADASPPGAHAVSGQTEEETDRGEHTRASLHLGDIPTSLKPYHSGEVKPVLKCFTESAFTTIKSPLRPECMNSGVPFVGENKSPSFHHDKLRTGCA